MPIALVLIAPALLAQPGEALARVRALARLTHYAGRSNAAPDMASALFAAVGMPPGTPIGPLALLGAGRDPGDDYVLCAQPVHLDAGAEHALHLAPVDDLSSADAESFVRMLDRHFADDDLRFDAARANLWFAHRRQDTDVVMTAPEAAQGRSLAAVLPRGADHRRWKRWQDEIAMLLFDHPANRARESEGKPAVNAVWFFGGGRLRPIAPAARLFVAAPPGLIGDVARGVARACDGERVAFSADLADALEEARASRQADARDIAVVSVADRHDAQAQVEQALAHLEAHDVDVVHLIGGGRGTMTWTARAPNWWRRQRVRALPRAFRLPDAPEATSVGDRRSAS